MYESPFVEQAHKVLISELWNRIDQDGCSKLNITEEHRGVQTDLLLSLLRRIDFWNGTDVVYREITTELRRMMNVLKERELREKIATLVKQLEGRIPSIVHDQEGELEVYPDWGEA